jgi:hypothetical protein
MLKSDTRPPRRTRFLRRVAAVSFAALVTAVGVAVAPSPAHAAWFIEGVYPSFFDCQNVGQGGVNLGRWAAYACEPDWGGNPNHYRLWVDVPTPQPPAPSSAAFYRLWNPTTGDHFHTLDPSEYQQAQQQGYVGEGIRATVPVTAGAGTVPFYRLRHPTTGDRFHTVDVNEYQSAQQLGYVGEGIKANVYPPNSTQGVPFHRLWNPTTGDHFHTVSQSEVQSAQQLGYVYEGVRARV